MTRPRDTHRSGSAVLALLIVGVAAPALAAPKRAGVPKFEGHEEALVRKKVMQVLKSKGYDLVKSREIDVALANSGVLLDSEEGFAKLAKELALSVVVSGGVGKKRAKIVAHDGRDGSVLGQAVFTGPNPRKVAAEIRRDLWKKLGRDIERGKAASGAKKPQKSAVAESPEDDENTPDAPEPSEPAESRKKPVADSEPVASVEAGAGDEGPKKKEKRKRIKMEDGEGAVGIEAEDEGVGPAADAPAIVELAVGPTGINRTFRYNDSLAALRPYTLPMGPAIGASLSVYPFASFGGFARNLGLDARIEYAFLISSTLEADATNPSATFGTFVREYTGGLRYRIPLSGGHHMFVAAGGGEHAFVFTTTDTSTPSLGLTPDTIYRFARAAAGARFELGGGWSLAFGAGYRAVLNGAGTDFGLYFPHRSVAGVDAHAMVGYRLTDEFEVRAGVDYRRYFYSMNSQCSGPSNCDQYVVGGAVNQYFAPSAVIAYRFGGDTAEKSAGDASRSARQDTRPTSEEPSSEGGDRASE